MVVKRILYAILTVLAVAAFIYTESGAALFVSVCLLALPLLSFFALIFARQKLKYDCTVQQSCMRGSSLEISIRVGVKPRILVGTVQIVAEIVNTTFSKTERKVFIFSDLTYSPVSYRYLSPDSGRIRIRILSVRLLGAFGICSLTQKSRLSYEASVTPVLYDDLFVTVGGANLQQSVGEYADFALRGHDRSEIFGVRDYSAGDNLNSVHWKLSSKFDSLKTKEYGSTSDYKLLVLVDLSRKKRERAATDGELNFILDTVISLSNAFMIGGIPHCVGWIDEGKLCYERVLADDDFLRMTYSLMSAKVSEGDAKTLFYLASSREYEQFNKCVLVTCEAQVAELKELGGEVTAIAVGEKEGFYAEDGVRIIGTTAENITKALKVNAV